MDTQNIKLPSNKNFGLFFSCIFVLLGSYFTYRNLYSLALIFFIATVLLIVISYANPKILLPLNKLWMRFGFLIGMVVQPIILGGIYFLIFTPISLLMKIFRRDELRIKLKKRTSHWRDRVEDFSNNAFKNQF